MLSNKQTDAAAVGNNQLVSAPNIPVYSSISGLILGIL